MAKCPKCSDTGEIIVPTGPDDYELEACDMCDPEEIRLAEERQNLERKEIDLIPFRLKANQAIDKFERTFNIKIDDEKRSLMRLAYFEGLTDGANIEFLEKVRETGRETLIKGIDEV